MYRNNSHSASDWIGAIEHYMASYLSHKTESEFLECCYYFTA